MRPCEGGTHNHRMSCEAARSSSCDEPCYGSRPAAGTTAQILQQQLQRRLRKHLHVRLPVAAARLQRHHLLDSAPRSPCSYGRRHRRSGCRSARWRRSPTGPTWWRNAARIWLCQQLCVRLRCRADALHVGIAHLHQQPPRIAGVDHGAAEEIGGCARHGQQRRRNQPARRRFRDRNRLLALDQFGARSARRYRISSFIEVLNSASGSASATPSSLPACRRASARPRG